MNESYIFIFEFVSGGGFSKVNIPSSLFCEGFGMLKSIITDFKALNFDIVTLLDYRIFYLSKLLQADRIEKINRKENYIKKFKKLVNSCKYCFIIAPESSNLLFDLSQIVSKNKKILLSTNLEGIKLGSSKIKTYEFFKISEFYTPKTSLIPFKDKNLDKDYIVDKFHKFNTPIVIKPNDGVGAESIYYFESEDQIKEFFQQNKYKFKDQRTYIIQKFVEGSDLSASLIGTHCSTKSLTNNIIFLSINSQNIKIKNLNYQSEYFGGYTPIEKHQQVEKQLKKLLETRYLSKFKGYFGLDFIRRADNSIHFIEINPRLTTSYIGLRNTINQNPAKLIMDSNSNFLESIKLKTNFHSLFSRIEMNFKINKTNREISKEQTLKLTKKIPEMVTPPISLNNSNQFSCFIATKTKDFASSRIRMNEIIQLIEGLDFEIVKSGLIKLL